MPKADAEFRVKVPRGTVRVVVENATAWRTGDLCRIIRGAVKFEEVPAGKTVWAEIVYTRGHTSCSGLGWYHTGRIRVRVPSQASLTKWNSKFPAVDFAHVVAHEIGHAIFNLPHERMGFSYVRGPLSDKMFAWAGAIPVRLKSAPRRPSVDVKRVKKLAHAQAQVVRYERRLKLTETVLKRWRKRVKDVERTLAKAATGRVDIKGALADPETRQRLVDGVVQFCCQLEGHDHKEVDHGTTDGHSSGESRDPVSVLHPDGEGPEVGE